MFLLTFGLFLCRQGIGSAQRAPGHRTVRSEGDAGAAALTH